MKEFSTYSKEDVIFLLKDISNMNFNLKFYKNILKDYNKIL